MPRYRKWGKLGHAAKKRRARLHPGATKTGIAYPVVFEYDATTGQVLRMWRVWNRLREAALPPNFIRFGRTLSRDDNLDVDGRLQLDTAGRCSVDEVHTQVYPQGAGRPGQPLVARTPADVRANVQAPSSRNLLSPEGRRVHQTSGLRFFG